MTIDRAIMPEDYLSLLAESGPGTLAGVLRLLAPEGPEGFNMEAEQNSLIHDGSLFTMGRFLGFWEVRDRDYGQFLVDARLWGIFSTGETCWWLPVTEDPADWLIFIIDNDGWQQLSIPTTEFLRRWTAGLLDLPVLSHGAVPREWSITPAGHPVPVPDVPEVARDPLAQLKTLIGPGHDAPVPFDWAAIEADLGRPLPPDYKLLHETFGRPDGDGQPSGRGDLDWNGIGIPSPLALRNMHEAHAEYDAFTDIWEQPTPDSPGPDDLLLCGSTAERTLMAWDTRDPDPARWPVISIAYGDADIIPGTLAEVLVAGLTRAICLGYDFIPGGQTPPFDV